MHPTHAGGAPFQLVEETLGSKPVMSFDSPIGAAGTNTVCLMNSSIT